MPLRDWAERVQPPTELESPHCPGNLYHQLQVRCSSESGSTDLLSDAHNCVIFFYWALGDAMYDHAQLEYATAAGNDYAAHEQMYHTFVALARISFAVIVTIVILMAIFLV